MANVIFPETEPLRLVRFKDGFGKMFYRGVYLCDTGENVDKIIPDGTYRLSWTYSPKFKAFRYMISDVPNRTRILIHEGNYPAKDSLGCVLVGVRKDNVLQYSSITLQRLNYNISCIEIPYIEITTIS